jgi:hypothetical protein
MLCKIYGFHGGEYEECLLLGVSQCDSFKTGVSEERIASITWMERISVVLNSYC